MKKSNNLPTLFQRIYLEFQLAISVCLLLTSTCMIQAHNGSVAYAYPVDQITIDGDLTDWPSHFTQYRLIHYQYGARPDHDLDNSAYFMAGYNIRQQALYFAVSLIDDDYVQSPEDPSWNLHDLQVLYLDVKHIAEGSGVIALAHCEYVREIVEQENLSWYPEVAEASWDQVDVQIARKGNITIYEWKTSLGQAVIQGNTLGFDYVIFDKDRNRDSRLIAWGEIDGTRHFNNQILGDLVLVDPDQPLAWLEGQIQWKNEMTLKMPDRIRFISETNPQQWAQAGIDSLGTYGLQLPEGIYRVSIPQKLIISDQEIYKAGGEETTRIELVAGTRKTLNHTVVKYPKPDLFPQKGILHEFDIEKTGFLDQFIEEYRKYFGIPGVSLALIKNGKVIYHQTYGWQNTITKEPVEENTLFEAASITKPVFAFIVLRLVEKGIIDLDKPLHEYLPFDELEGSPDYKLMTGRHVLIHQSGLPNWGRELKNTPGTKYGYSGEGFEYLKRVVMKITGKDMNTIIREELTTPLNLYNFHFSDNPQLRKMATDGHFDGMPTIQYWPPEPGMAWSMFTESNAFSRFALAILHREGLQKTTYDKMLQIYSEFPLEEGEPRPEFPEGMGLGIAIRDTPYGMAFSHGGNNGDFKCHFEVFDKLQMGYIIFTNSNRGDLLHSDLTALLVEGKRDNGQ